MDRYNKVPRIMAIPAIAAAFGLALSTDVSPVAAQEAGERYYVLVANFAPIGGAKDNFGKDIAKKLREAVDDMPTHQPFEGGDFKDALKKYGLKEEDLAEADCIKARQLATQENVQLVLCGSYDQQGQVDAKIISPQTFAVFEVPTFSSTNPEEAARQITTAFQNYTQALSQTVYCSDYIQSEQYEMALEACDKALAIDANSRGALSGKGAALYYLDRKEEALQHFERVLEQDALDQNALKFAGIIAIELGKMEDGRRYFQEYLELNPGDNAVRLTIAGDMANAGDFEGALGVVEQGMTDAEPDADLQAYAGSLAIQAAEKRAAEYAGAGDPTAEEVPAEARALYEKAITYFEPVLEANGDQTDPAVVRNLLVAHTKLGNTQEALALGQRATQLFPQDAQLWQVYALGLKEQGDLEGALDALDKASAADPNISVNRQKMAWLIEAGRVAEAAPAARAVVQNNEMPVEEVVRFIAGTGWNEYGKPGNHQEAIKYYELAEELAPNAQARAFPSFFHGYALLQIGIQQQNPSTVESARASLPTFQRAKQLLDAAAGYQEQEQTRQQLLSNVNDYIAIQEALIKRGR